MLLKSVEEYHKSLAKEGEYNTDLQKKPNLPHLWPTYRAYNSFLAGLNSLSRLKLRRALKKKRAVENSSEYRTLECKLILCCSIACCLFLQLTLFRLYLRFIPAESCLLLKYLARI